MVLIFFSSKSTLKNKQYPFKRVKTKADSMNYSMNSKKFRIKQKTKLNVFKSKTEKEKKQNKKNQKKDIY